MPIPGIRRFESITFGSNGSANITTGQSTVAKVHATISNPHHSFYNFGFHTQVPKNIPKLKHTFMVEFVLNKNIIFLAGAQSGGVGDFDKPIFLKHSLEPIPYDRELSFAVKSFDRPKINIDIQTLNQYNKKRLIQQQLEYQAVNVRFYDAGNNAAQKLVKEYLQYYFGDQRTVSESDWTNDIINDELKFAKNGTGWGFNPLSDELYFFKEINIYQFYGRRRYDKFTYIHPKIQAIDLDSGDYAVSEALEINLTLMYEGVIIELDKELVLDKPTDASRLDATSDAVPPVTTDLNEKFRFSETANVPQPNENQPAEIKSGTFPSRSASNIVPVGANLTLNNQVNRVISDDTSETSRRIAEGNAALSVLLVARARSLEDIIARLKRFNPASRQIKKFETELGRLKATLANRDRQKESVLANRAGDIVIPDVDTNDTVDRQEKHNNPNSFETKPI